VAGLCPGSEEAREEEGGDLSRKGVGIVFLCVDDILLCLHADSVELATELKPARRQVKG
jgi:hypothetical protein